MKFDAFPKIPRLFRDIVITEKLDGTNAQIAIVSGHECMMNGGDESKVIGFDASMDFYMFAGSRKRWITPEDDNFGFARWAKENSKELFQLGEGCHFGEWWGAGIQRKYGLDHKRFSLFNVHRWLYTKVDGAILQTYPKCCDVVPTLYRGENSQFAVEECLDKLNVGGSVAVPGFMNPEGIVVYHRAANQVFKVTIENDESPKGQPS